MSTIKLYRHPLSGHSHRVELFLSLLGLESELITVDLGAGEHKSDTFLAKNSLGQVPVLEDGDLTLADSNGILVYLSNQYDKENLWYPKDAEASSAVQRFLSIAAGQIANGPASARLVNVFGATLDHERAKTIAEGILAVLDEHLATRQFLVNERPTIADVANYSYIAHAPEGDVSLENFPNVCEWLERIEALEGFVPMQATAVGLAA